jgi:bifunctional UDP-N-acetylglucosamine pyrophosphorylase/glucosamine-1-phosphate N-acetyltransferase
MPTSQPRFGVAIMAAGKGTRLKSKRPKVLHEIGGKPLLTHVISAAARIVSQRDIVVIIGHEADKVRAAVASTGVRFALQAQQLGTGHAMMAAREELQGYDAVLVLSGDVPLIRPQTITAVRDFHLKRRAAMTILTALPADPFGYGRIIRKSARSADVKAIVEQKALSKAQAKTREINSGIYAFNARDLWSNIDRLKTDNPHKEYYLTDLAAMLVRARKKVVAIPAQSPIEVLGANTIAELMDLDRSFRESKTRELMAAGVSIYRPETVTIDAEVEIGADTVIEPFVQVLGTTRIGEECRIRSYSVISNSEIASGATIRPGCILDEARVASGAIIGPYSHLRPGSDIGENAHVGNFVETKKVRLGKGSKANHLTYLGDAEIGAGVNVGAGTITCNYDGVHKHLTRIEDGVFVGSDSTLVAPVTLGKGAYVAASSCITEDVPADSLAIARSKQTVKDGWARAKREARAAAKK